LGKGALPALACSGDDDYRGVGEGNFELGASIALVEDLIDTQILSDRYAELS
jgi:hypothetical protein